MQQEIRKQNLKRFKITYSSSFIQIEAESLTFRTQILIDKRRPKSKIVFQNTSKKFEFDEAVLIKQCSLILGVITIKQQKFLIYVENVYKQPLMVPVGYSLYQIANIAYLPFSAKVHKDNEAILQTLQKEIFSFSFYFSFERDLTLRCELNYSPNTKKSVNRYFWNQSMLDALMEGKNYSEWKIPVIQGHYRKFQSHIGQSKIVYTLLSRRSKERSGTRFYSRGIDEKGNCSNTVETEQIVILGKYLISCVFLSGSTPVFWQQKSQTADIKLTRNKQLTKGPFLEHLNILNSQYGNIMLFNLLERKKESESILIKAYEQIFTETEPQLNTFCRYIYFDINESLKQNNTINVQNIILKMDPIIQSFGCFIFEIEEEKIISHQNGIFRVSCLDCLNRTNTFLESLAMHVLELQVEILGISGLGLLQDLLQRVDEEKIPLVRNFKETWIEKADFQSLIYAGTRAASGRKDKFLDQIDNSFISLQRLYNQKFMDRMKQNSIDLLHSHHNKANPSQRHTSHLEVSIITWNVNATHPQKLKLQKLTKSLTDSDLVVIGLQEMIDLHPKDVVLDEEESKLAGVWERCLSKALNAGAEKGRKFLAIQKIEMVGLFLVVFINEKWKNTLRSVQKDSVKTGMGGTFGNKGGVVMRLKIFDTTLCFSCSHLAAGESKVKERVDDFVQIHKKAFQQNKQGIQNQMQIEQSDHKFFFGDLNFRIKGQFKDFQELFEVAKKTNDTNYVTNMEKIIEDFSIKDQLYELRMSSDTSYYLASYSEEPVRFPPTYKLEKATGYYTVEKSRNPSWCDRILYWSDDLENHTCQCNLYSSLPLTGSDHRPVVGKFTVTVLKQQSKSSKNEVMEVGKEFRDTLNESPNDPFDLKQL